MTARRIKLVICVSGHVCAGKTTLATRLLSLIPDAAIISSRALLEREMPGASRSDLQSLGARLDRETQGRWVAAAVGNAPAKPIVFDAVRTRDQVLALGATATSCIHVHLRAPLEVLIARYELRRERFPEIEEAAYGNVLNDATESAIDGLADTADMILDSSAFSADTCAAMTAFAVRDLSA